MKKLIYMVAFLIPTIFFAQEKPKNVSEETTTKTITVDDGREVVEKKVKVTTREEQNIELEDTGNNIENKDMVKSPSKITQTLEVDDDRDQYYDSISESVFYTYNNDYYVFKKNNNGFLVTGKDYKKQSDFGRFMITNRANNYVFTSEDYNGIGYFNDSNNFVVEYYDPSKNAIVKQIFTLSK